jgi:hypothetical protein
MEWQMCICSQKNHPAIDCHCTCILHMAPVVEMVVLLLALSVIKGPGPREPHPPRTAVARRWTWKPPPICHHCCELSPSAESEGAKHMGRMSTTPTASKMKRRSV